MKEGEPFTFKISLSVLNHLGRQLYRSFATVLGEAISNAWDAEAKNVWIVLDKDRKGMWVKDDGVGMTARDFQDKFLKLGYSKRKNGKHKSPKGRPYIGRKGIGKLALLSCAERISVLTKIRGAEYVGGSIHNPDLDDAITDDLTPQDYPLEPVSRRKFSAHTRGHSHGTIIRFEGLKDGAKRSHEFLGKVLALYFRFSLLDKSFKIHLNGEEISYRHLADLAEKTEYLWRIGDYEDPFLEDLVKRFEKEPKHHECETLEVPGVRGFIASVRFPRDLKVWTTDERVGVDLFVNGRMRERDILKHIPTAQLPESYLYGQIHFDELDDKVDRFTSSREGIVADDPKYASFLKALRKVILEVTGQWDEWRVKHRKEGDPENPRIPVKARASRNLYNVVAQEYEQPKGSKSGDKVDEWVDALGGDAQINFASYAECFISENLVRKFIREKQVPLSAEAKERAEDYKKRERDSKARANISIEIRRAPEELGYLAMDDLANLVDKAKDKVKDPGLSRDAVEFKPMRDAMAHTALLTDQAKAKLNTVRENIKARVNHLLKGS